MESNRRWKRNSEPKMGNDGSSWRRNTNKVVQLKSVWNELLSRLKNIDSNTYGLHENRHWKGSGLGGPPPTMEKEFEAICQKINEIPLQPLSTSLKQRHQQHSRRSGECRMEFLLALIGAPPAAEPHFSGQVCSILTRLLRHYSPRATQAELIELANLLLRLIKESKGTLFAAEPLQAMSQLVYAYGGRLSELYSSLVPLLLESSHACSVNMAAKQAVIGILGNLVVRGWPDLEKDLRNVVVGHLLDTLEAFWRSAWDGDVENLKLVSLVLYALNQVSQVTDGAKLLEASLAKIFFALNSILQPVSEGLEQMQAEESSDTSSLLCPSEDGFVHSNRGLQRVVYRTLLQGLQLLTILCQKLSKAAKGHFHLFLPDYNSRVKQHSFLLPRKEAETGPKAAPLLHLISSHPSDTIRCQSLQAVTALVKAVPWRLWLQSVRGADTTDSSRGGHLSSRALCAAANMLSCLEECLMKEPSQSVLCDACSCAASLVPELSSPMSSNPELVDIAVSVLSQIGIFFFQGSVQSPRNPPSAFSKGNSTLALAATAGRALTACFAAHLPQTPLTNQAMVVFLEQFRCQAGLPFVQSLLHTIQGSDSFRSESLLLISRIANLYWNVLFPFWDTLTEILKGCLRNSDQNVRLHALKVLEEILKTREKCMVYTENDTPKKEVLCSKSDQEHLDLVSEQWILDFYQFLKSALKDPYHGVRTVSCACLGLFTAQDWQCVGPFLALKEVCSVCRDSSPGVRAGVLKCLGKVASFVPHYTWCQHTTITRMINQVISSSTQDDKVGVRAQAFGAIECLAKALFSLCPVLQEEVAEYKDRGKLVQDDAEEKGKQSVETWSKIFSEFSIEEMVGRCIEVLTDQEKVSFNAIKSLGYLTNLMRNVCFDHTLLHSLQAHSISALINVINDVDGEIQDKHIWTVCEALERILMDSTVKKQLGTAEWSLPLYEALCCQLSESENFKVLTHACDALSIPDVADQYNGQLLTILELAFKALEKVEKGSTFQQLKFQPSLKYSLNRLLVHGMLIWDLNEPTDFMFEIFSIFLERFSDIVFAEDAQLILDIPRYKNIVLQELKKCKDDMAMSKNLFEFIPHTGDVWISRASQLLQEVGSIYCSPEPLTTQMCYQFFLLKSICIVHLMPAECIKKDMKDIFQHKVSEAICALTWTTSCDFLDNKILNPHEAVLKEEEKVSATVINSISTRNETSSPIDITNNSEEDEM